MTEDAYVQMVETCAALFGVIGVFPASRLLRNTWFASQAGEWMMLALFISSLGLAMLSSTLIWKATGIAGFFFFLGTGHRLRKFGS